jgi:hypothetical protein
MIDDLLKMALQGGGNPPNMGANALQVGQAMAPMTPPGPDSVGPLGSMGWQRERNEQMDMLRQAGGLAQLDAIMKAQQAGEWQEDGPLRANARMLRNRLLQDETDNIDGTIKDRETKRNLDRVKSRAEMVKAEMQRLDPYIEAWGKSETYPERNNLFRMLQDSDEGFGPRKFKTLKFEEADMLMQALKKAKGMTKGDIETAKVEQKERDSIRDNETLLSKEQIRGRNQAEQARIRAMSADERKSKWEQLLQAAETRDLTPAEQRTFMFLTQMKALSASAAADRAPPRTRVDGNRVVTEPVPHPTLPTPPGTTPAGPPPDNTPKRVAPPEDVAKFKKLMADPKYASKRQAIIAEWQRKFSTPVPK